MCVYGSSEKGNAERKGKVNGKRTRMDVKVAGIMKVEVRIGSGIGLPAVVACIQLCGRLHTN